MKWGVGVMAAPRPISSVDRTVESLRRTGFERAIVFLEPGTEGVVLPHNPVILRPASIEKRYDLLPSSNGTFGNFQNFVQSLSDLRTFFPSAERYLLVEDDAVFCSHLHDFLSEIDIPSRCGALSLYCPNLRSYKTSTVGINHITRPNHVGALATVFTRSALIRLLSVPTIDWQGGKRQSNPAPWERVAADAWLGQAVRVSGGEVHCFSPSLVLHWSPPLMEPQGNSSVANGPNRGPRQAFRFIGEEADPRIIFKNLRK